MPLRKLIFDTSAVNALGLDPDIASMLKGLGLSYVIGITETVLAEIVATPDEEIRRGLLAVLDRLVHPGYCLMPYQWTIEHQAKAFDSDRSGFDWRKLHLRFLAGEVEITKQEFVHTISEETRMSNLQLEKAFKALFAQARPPFQKLFESGEERPSFRAVTEHLLADGGAYLSIGAGLMERATGKRPTESDVKEFIEACPPFKALLVALCFAQYDRCIRGENMPSLGRAGRNDMY